MIHIEDVEEGCLSQEEDDLQYGPWLRAMAPKIRQRKKNFNQPKSSDNDNEDTQVSEGEDGDGEPSPSRHQQIIQLLTGNSTTRITCQQLGDSVKWLGGSG